MTIVSAKRTTCLPSVRTSRPTSGPLEMASSPSGTTSVTANTALKSGSSQHGKARRQSVACIWLVAMTRSTPSSSLNVDRYQPRSLSLRTPVKLIDRRPCAPAGSAVSSAKARRSCSSSSLQPGRLSRPSTTNVASSMASSAALHTSSSVASSATKAISTVPLKVALLQVRLEDDLVAHGTDGARQSMGVARHARSSSSRSAPGGRRGPAGDECRRRSRHRSPATRPGGRSGTFGGGGSRRTARRAPFPTS